MLSLPLSGITSNIEWDEDEFLAVLMIRCETYLQCGFYGADVSLIIDLRFWIWVCFSGVSCFEDLTQLNCGILIRWTLFS